MADAARDREQQADDELRDGPGVGARACGHDDPALRGGGQVDVVDADAVARDHLEPARALDDGAIDRLDTGDPAVGRGRERRERGRRRSPS